MMRGYKTFFMLDSAEQIFHANKYQITNNCNSYLLNIAEHEISLLINKCQLLLAFSYLLAEKFSWLAELSMKKVL